MSKKIKPQDNSSNIKNPNEGLSGTNVQYDLDQANRKKQLEEKARKKK